MCRPLAGVAWFNAPPVRILERDPSARHPAFWRVLHAPGIPHPGAVLHSPGIPHSGARFLRRAFLLLDKKVRHNKRSCI
jgi:hypothetical protein